MNQTSEMCCFCLSACNVPFKDLFTKSGDGLSHFEKISSSLSRLVKILNENAAYHYKICDKCCDTIEVVYQFNQTCLHNVGIYLSYKGTIKVEMGMEQSSQIFESCDNRVYDAAEKFVIKSETFAESKVKDNLSEYLNSSQEFIGNYEKEDVLNLTNCCQVDVGTTCTNSKMKRNLILKNKTRNKNMKGTEKDFEYSSSVNTIKKNNNDESSKENPLNIARRASYKSQELGESSKSSQSPTHKKRIQNSKKEIPCPKCKKTFKKLSILNRHLIIHSGIKSFICISCGKTFYRKDNLDLHMRTVHQHSEIRKKRGRPAIHEKFEESEKKKLNCELCGKRFKYKTNLDNHLYDRHGVGEPTKNYKILKSCICETCGKTFSKKSNLDAHLLIHTGVRAYVCDICGKSFTQKFSLNVHMNIHTGNKPYKCNLCSKTFPQKANLRKHKLIHSGERPHSCEQCDLTFYSTSNLSRHRKTHSGEKSFKCDVCGRTFADKSSYKRHNLIHTGEKPHSCDICNQAFIQKTSLIQHKQKYHKT